MAAKRLREDAESIPDHQESKRIRRLPSFTMVIRQAVFAKSVQNFCLALEPLLRRVVQEELDRSLARPALALQRSPQMFIEEARHSSCLQLIFEKPPCLPIFTDNRIEDEDGNPLKLLLVDSHTGKRPQASFPLTMKVELVVLDGEFPCEDRDDWSSVDFNCGIVKERRGKRPLLTGDIVVTMKDGAAIIDDLKFTDNSSWIRSRNFRIGARVLLEKQEGSQSFREAMTDRFVVKDHRGESYKKHYPPSLGDDVWRLEKIGKDGVFHKRLAAKGMKTVQDFLKLSMFDSSLLRQILGMSDRNWDAAINHARTCPLGDKLYVYRVSRYAIFLSPICEVIRVEIDGFSCPLQELNKTMEVIVHELLREAYKHWDKLEEINVSVQDQSPSQVMIEQPYQIESFVEVDFIQNDMQMEISNWTPMIQNIFME